MVLAGERDRGRGARHTGDLRLERGLVLYAIWALAMLVPTLALAVRRLHDTGKSGWLLLIGLIPFGGIVLLGFYLLDSTPCTNQYGMSPKYPNG